MELEEKSQDHQSQYDTLSANHEYNSQFCDSPSYLAT